MSLLSERMKKLTGPTNQSSKAFLTETNLSSTFSSADETLGSYTTPRLSFSEQSGSVSRLTSKISPNTTSPTLTGASRRLARKLTSKVITKRDVDDKVPIRKEPTYRTEPKVPFSTCTVEKLLKSTMDDRLKNFRYHPKFSANMIKILSDEIRDKVKKLHYDRYKIVCILHMSPKRQQGMVVSSRCTWNEHLDNYANYTFEKEQLMCTGTVYGLYQD